MLHPLAFPVTSGQVTLKYESNDRVTVYDRKHKRLVRGNTDFGSILQLCDGKHSVDDIITSISQNAKNDPADLRSTVVVTLQQLEADSIIQVGNDLTPRTIRVRQADLEFPLDTVYLEPTRRCNMRCIHCYARAPSHTVSMQSEEMTLAELSRVFHNLDDLGVLYVCFTGGEPFLHEDFSSILEQSHSLGFDLGLFTNGSLLSDHILDLLGIIDPQFIAVSLESQDPEKYETIRQGADFSIVLTNLTRMLENTLRLRINCVLFKGINDSRSDIIAYLTFLKQLGVPPDCITFDQFSPEGEGEGARQYLINEYDVVESIKAAFAEVFCWHIEPRTLAPESQEWTQSYCGLGTSMLNIKSNGEITLCPALTYADCVMGNVREDLLLSVWQNSAILHYFRTGRHLKNEACSVCNWLDECNGGCKAKSLTFSGTFDARDHWMCSYYQVQPMVP